MNHSQYAESDTSATQQTICGLYRGTIWVPDKYIQLTFSFQPSSGEIFNLKFDLPIPFGMGAAGADTTGGLAKAIGLGGGGGNPLPE